MTNLSKLKKNILALFLAVLLLFSGQLFLPTNFARVSAEESKYTDVLDDLSKLDNFDKSKYILDLTNFDLEVITIAESVDNVLFVYVYQPSAGNKGVLASSINISTGVGDALSYSNYDLNLINCNGVFYKYFVSGLTVSSDNERIYEISSIFRKPIDDNEKNLSSFDNTVGELSFKVGFLYTFKNTSDDKCELTVNPIELITITNKLVGFLRYNVGFLGSRQQDTYFVAFSTDYFIEDLYEADVYFGVYDYYYYYYHTFGTSYTEEYSVCNPCSCGKNDLSKPCNSDNCSGVFIKKNVKLSANNDMEIGSNGWLNISYSFPVIQRSSDFIKSSEISTAFKLGPLGSSLNSSLSFEESDKQLIGETDWVLRFFSAPYSYSSFNNRDYSEKKESRCIVGDVSILRLKFLGSDDLVHNLGVVDNKQTGSKDPVAETKNSLEISLLTKIIALIAVILICVIIGPFLSPVLTVVFQFLGKIFGWLFRNIWKILTFPFRLFKRKSIPKTRKRKR